MSDTNVTLINEKTKIPLFNAIIATMSITSLVVTIMVYVIPAIAKNTEQDNRLDRQGLAITEMRNDNKVIIAGQAELKAQMAIMIEMMRSEK